MRPLALFSTLVLSVCGLSACGAGEPRPAVQTAADSLAMGMIDGAGGWAAWASLPPIRFDWVFERDGEERFRARHLWDKASDRARVEWPVGEDSTAVVLLDLAASTPEAPAGTAYLNGVASAPEDSVLADGYSRFVNDTYWMVAPFKTFDPGVRRTLDADSSRGALKALALSFGDVGLTPGDRYWMRAGASGGIGSWSYVLEGDTTASTWTWGSPQAVSTPAGPLQIQTRKVNGPASILTIPLSEVPVGAWTSPTPVL